MKKRLPIKATSFLELHKGFGEPAGGFVGWVFQDFLGILQVLADLNSLGAMLFTFAAFHTI